MPIRMLYYILKLLIKIIKTWLFLWTFFIYYVYIPYIYIYVHCLFIFVFSLCIIFCLSIHLYGFCAMIDTSPNSYTIFVWNMYVCNVLNCFNIEFVVCFSGDTLWINFRFVIFNLPHNIYFIYIE